MTSNVQNAYVCPMLECDTMLIDAKTPETQHLGYSDRIPDETRMVKAFTRSSAGADVELVIDIRSPAACLVSRRIGTLDSGFNVCRKLSTTCSSAWTTKGSTTYTLGSGIVLDQSAKIYVPKSSKSATTSRHSSHVWRHPHASTCYRCTKWPRRPRRTTRISKTWSSSIRR
jgi:hypothetical protein